MRGRIRTVKPELFKSEKLWDLQVQTGLPLTQAFIGLFCYADREGRFEWRPRALKSDVLPYWDGDFEEVLKALASKMYIVRYTVAGKDYGFIRDWRLHQAIGNKEVPSEIPSPSDHAKASLEASEENLEAPERKGREGKGREGEWEGGMGDFAPPSAPLDSHDATPLHRDEDGDCRTAVGARIAPEPSVAPKPRPKSKRPSTSLPDDFVPNDSARYLARTLSVDLELELPAFVDHHRARGSTFSDWQAAMRTWIRNSAKWAVPKSGRRASEQDERLSEQAKRVAMLRAQEAEDERRASGGGT